MENIFTDETKINLYAKIQKNLSNLKGNSTDEEINSIFEQIDPSFYEDKQNIIMICQFFGMIGRYRRQMGRITIKLFESIMTYIKRYLPNESSLFWNIFGSCSYFKYWMYKEGLIDINQILLSSQSDETSLTAEYFLPEIIESNPDFFHKEIKYKFPCFSTEESYSIEKVKQLKILREKHLIWLKKSGDYHDEFYREIEKDPIRLAIKTDDISTFQMLISRSNLSINSKISESIIEHFLRTQIQMHLIDYAANYCAFNIFNFLILNGAKIEIGILNFVIHSDNYYMIHIVESKINQIFRDHAMFFAIIGWNYEFIKYIIDNYGYDYLENESEEESESDDFENRDENEIKEENKEGNENDDIDVSKNTDENEHEDKNVTNNKDENEEGSKYDDNNVSKNKDENEHEVKNVNKNKDENEEGSKYDDKDVSKNTDENQYKDKDVNKNKDEKKEGSKYDDNDVSKNKDENEHEVKDENKGKSENNDENKDSNKDKDLSESKDENENNFETKNTEENKNSDKNEDKQEANYNEKDKSNEEDTNENEDTEEKDDENKTNDENENNSDLTKNTQKYDDLSIIKIIDNTIYCYNLHFFKSILLPFLKKNPQIISNNFQIIAASSFTDLSFFFTKPLIHFKKDDSNPFLSNRINSLLVIAIDNNNTRAIEKFIEYPNIDPNGLFFYACANFSNMKIIEILSHHPDFDCNFRHPMFNISIFQISMIKGNFFVLKYLIQNFSNLKTGDLFDEILYCIKYNHLMSLKIYIEFLMDKFSDDEFQKIIDDYNNSFLRNKGNETYTKKFSQIIDEIKNNRS